MSELVTTHWIFVTAEREYDALDFIFQNYIDQRGCDWAIDGDLAGGVVHGADKREFAKTMTQVRRTQRRAVEALVKALPAEPMQLLMEGFDPYVAAPNGGAVGQTIAAAGSLLGGMWHPLSGGFDHVAMTADLSHVKARMRRIPDKQFAVAVAFTY